MKNERKEKIGIKKRKDERKECENVYLFYSTTM